MEHVHPILIGRGRANAEKERLCADEFQQYRSLICKFNWVARESRPEASGTASLRVQTLQETTVADLKVANKMAKRLRSTASQSLSVWKLDAVQIRLVSVSDSGGVGSDAMMVLATPAGEVKYGADLPAVPLAWRSSHCRRVVNFTLAGETQAAVSATAEAEWIQSLAVEVVTLHV